MDVGFPVEITLDEVTVFDAQANIVYDVTVVYDVELGIVKNKVRALVPDGRVLATEFRIQSSLADLIGLVTPESPEAQVRFNAPGGAQVDGLLRLDPHHLDRFFLRIGEAMYGHGRRISGEGADVALLIAWLLGASLDVDRNWEDGDVGIEFDPGGLDDFFMPEGYEVEVEISGELDLGFMVITIEIKIHLGGDDSG